MVLNLDIAVVLEREDGDGDGEGVVNVGFAGLRIGSETCGEGDVEEGGGEGGEIGDSGSEVPEERED